MNVSFSKLTSLLFAGAAAATIGLAPVASAAPPPPPPCTQADGTPCSDIGNVGPGGATWQVPGGPGGTADSNSAAGGIPYGPSGSANGGGASGCIPYVGCATIPAP